MAGRVLYIGPSTLTPARDIVVVLTGLPDAQGQGGRSTNRKTGEMVQAWVLVADVHPVLARATEADAAVCGSCPYRDGSCYVVLNFAPAAVWRTWQAGGYPPYRPGDVAGQVVRLGAYGDPAAVPWEAWKPVVREARGWVGYTHQWRDCDPRFRVVCMASVDSREEYWHARIRGWRTFRVRSPLAGVERREKVCPASQEGGHRTVCADCLLCSGTAGREKPAGVAICAHGSAAGFYYQRMQQELPFNQEGAGQ